VEIVNLSFSPLGRMLMAAQPVEEALAPSPFFFLPCGVQIDNPTSPRERKNIRRRLPFFLFFFPRREVKTVDRLMDLSPLPPLKKRMIQGNHLHSVPSPLQTEGAASRIKVDSSSPPPFLITIYRDGRK